MSAFDEYIENLTVKIINENRKRRDRNWFIAIIIIVGGVMVMCMYNLSGVI